ncbi:MAG: hypothetical protein JRE20_14220, partial [Deltaproteobacteria bacterium]|nr:hypothetical protein [Deltaproteobacteria bacterium]
QPYGKRLAAGGSAEIRDFLSADDIDYLGSLIPEPQPHTMNFFMIMKAIGGAFGGKLEQISEERPDIMQQLMAMRSVHRESVLTAKRKNGCAIVT